MKRPTKVEALPEFRLRVAYPDGVEGVIDLAADVGRGVFTPLADDAFFRTVHIGQFGQIAWSEATVFKEYAILKAVRGALRFQDCAGDRAYSGLSK